MKPPDFSEGGDGIVFAAQHGTDIAYSQNLGWLRWTGTLWEMSDSQVFGVARDDSETRLKEAAKEYTEAAAAFHRLETAEEPDPDELKAAKKTLDAAKRYLSHAKAGRRVIAMKNTLAAAKPTLEKSVERFDADWFLLATPAGVVDLRSGQIYPSSPLYFNTKITAVSPSKTGMDEWQKAIYRATGGDVEFAAELQIRFGSALFGRVFQEGLCFVDGLADSGKSTISNAIFRVLGTYSASFSVDILTDTKNSNFRHDAVNLRGVRFALAGELDPGRRLSTSVLKQLTSRDPIHAERKFHDPFDFLPSHSTFIYTNFLPNIATFDSGTWRRISVLPFNAVIPENEKDPNFENHLFEDCGGAILQWLIDGAARFHQQGYKITPSAAVREATARYRRSQNWAAPFLSSEFVDTDNPNARSRPSELYDSYRTWSQTTNNTTFSQKEFSQALTEAGFSDKTVHGKRYFIGIAPVAPVEHEPLEIL